LQAHLTRDIKTGSRTALTDAYVEQEQLALPQEDWDVVFPQAQLKIMVIASVDDLSTSETSV
jgi:hypothetical protein